MLPPQVSQSDFADALREFAAIVGDEWVFTKQADVDLYKDAYSLLPGQPEEKVASAAVAPQSAEEVQAIVRVANKYKVPIYPISTGKNLGFGGSAPVQSGSVILDLKRMNRIIEVSETGHYAVVEPGVSYFDLYRYIQDQGLKVWIDTPDPGWGSVIGNPLDHGFGYTPWPYRDHWDSHCGMEVVLPNGEMMRTGMWALGGADKSRVGFQVKFGAGPMVDGLFLQSTLGVVTKMAIWLMPQPEAYLSTYVQVLRYEDLGNLLETYKFLSNSGIVTGLTVPLNPIIADVEDNYPGLVPPADPEARAILLSKEYPDPAVLNAYARKVNKGVWGMKFQFYGGREINEAHWNYTKKKLLERIPDALFGVLREYDLPLTKEQRDVNHLPSFGIPSLSAFFLGTRAMMAKPQRGHLWLSACVPLIADEVIRAQKILLEASHKYKFYFNPINLPYAEWSHMAGRMVLAWGVDEDPEMQRKNVESVKAVMALCADNGWGEVRTHTFLHEDLMKTYSYNNHALRRFHEAIKDAIDPNGIMANGRYGIWPKRFRPEQS